MSRKRSRFDRLMLPTLAAGVVIGTASLATAVPIPIGGAGYAQNFDTLSNAGSSAALPPGWVLSETGTNADGQYTAGTGSSNAGDMYSFGAISSPERALGGLRSGSVVPTFGVEFVNNSGGTITDLTVSYTGEMWRAGVTNRNAADRLDFSYSTNATSLTTGTYIDDNLLDYNSTNINTAAGALDGNAVSNKTTLTKTISGLSIANGSTFWMKWSDFDISSSDDGLAVDNFTVAVNGGSAPPFPPPPPPPPPFTGSLFINEVDYDQPTSDTGEFIEIAGLAGSYSNVVLLLINGADNTVYQTINLPNFTLANESNGYGFFVLAGTPANVPNTDLDLTPDSDLIQNGAPDAIALLVDGVVVHFLSYEGNTSLLIGGLGQNDGGAGVVDDGNTANFSIQKVGTGGTFQAFSFSTILRTPGAVNTGQTLVAAAIVPEPASLSMIGIAAIALLRRRRQA